MGKNNLETKIKAIKSKIFYYLNTKLCTIICEMIRPHTQSNLDTV